MRRSASCTRKSFTLVPPLISFRLLMRAISSRSASCLVNYRLRKSARPYIFGLLADKTSQHWYAMGTFRRIMLVLISSYRSKRMTSWIRGFTSLWSNIFWFSARLYSWRNCASSFDPRTPIIRMPFVSSNEFAAGSSPSFCAWACSRRLFY